jgi:GntR family transcriptional regulator, transcriptional repressor for pyruvate dehydrogenase complex
MESAAQLVAFLQGQIHRGQMGPGDRLASERDLAATHRVSRLLVREALASLEGDGYVVTRRGATGGRFVTSLELPFQTWAALRLGDLDDIIDFRLAVECQAVRFAAERRTKADLSAIVKAARQLERAKSPRDYRLADVAFHAALADASKSSRLAASVERARGDLFEPTDDLWHEGLDLTIAQHQAITAAVTDGAPDRAASAMSAHIESTRTEMHELVQSTMDPSTSASATAPPMEVSSLAPHGESFTDDKAPEKSMV